MIPDTFLRPSRDWTLKVEIPLPNEITWREYFTHKEVPENDIEELVSKSNNFFFISGFKRVVHLYLFIGLYNWRSN